MQIVVHSYCLRGARQEPLLPAVTLTPSTLSLTVAELIRLTVIEQIAVLSVQHWLEQLSLGEVLDRQYLSERDVQRQAREGAVLMPQASVSREVDSGLEIERALHGFQARAFRILHNGVMLQELEELVDVRAPSTLAFIRLVPLVGG